MKKKMVLMREREMFSFPHLMTIAKRALPPSERDWLAASDLGDKQC